MLSPGARAILRQLNQRKYIPFPQGGRDRGVLVGEYAPIINHPYFLLLKNKKQLGNVYSVFVDASHTRWLHSLDALCVQRERSDFWQEYGMVSREDARCLNIFALLHDIGHRPFSHITDRVCRVSHDENALAVLAEMRGAIERCRVPYERIHDLFTSADPLAKAVKHHPLGTDKLSYLVVDAKHCISGGPDLSRLPQYVFWLDCDFAVHVKCLYDVLGLKQFYLKMYREVYLRKSCLIGQRILEKEIFRLLTDRGVSESQLWEMTEEQVIGLMSQTDGGRKNYMRYQNLDSKTVVAFKLPGFGWAENTSGKPLAVFEKEQDFFDKMEKNTAPGILEKKEFELATALGIDPADLDIVPPIALYRFSLPPVRFVNNMAAFTDHEKLPDSAAAEKELAAACTVMRVCVSRHLREEVFKQAGLIEEFVSDWKKSV